MGNANVTRSDSASVSSQSEMTAAMMQQADEIDYTKADPNTMVKVVIHDSANAGKAPATRFGRVKFDEDGDSEMQIALKDLPILHSWGWLSQEDQEKYLGLAAVQPQVVDEAQHNAELDAVRAANTKLAQRNADLEARLEDADARFRREFNAFQTATNAQIEELKQKLSEATFKLSTELEAAVKERDMYKAQAEAAAVASDKKAKKGS